MNTDRRVATCAALMQALAIHPAGLGTDENLAPVTEAFRATGTLADHWLLWPGRGFGSD